MSTSTRATSHEVRDTADSYALTEAGGEVVPAGYMRTEVGVIPEEWQVQELADLKPFITSGSRGWADYYSNHGSAFIRITNMSRDSIYLDLDDLKLVNLPPDSTEGVRTQLQDGDLLVSITAAISFIPSLKARRVTTSRSEISSISWSSCRARKNKPPSPLSSPTWTPNSPRSKTAAPRPVNSSRA